MRTKSKTSPLKKEHPTSEAKRSQDSTFKKYPGQSCIEGNFQHVDSNISTASQNTSPLESGTYSIPGSFAPTQGYFHGGKGNNVAMPQTGSHRHSYPSVKHEHVAMSSPQPMHFNIRNLVYKENPNGRTSKISSQSFPPSAIHSIKEHVNQYPIPVSSERSAITDFRSYTTQSHANARSRSLSSQSNIAQMVVNSSHKVVSSRPLEMQIKSEPQQGSLFVQAITPPPPPAHSRQLLTNTVNQTAVRTTMQPTSMYPMSAYSPLNYPMGVGVPNYATAISPLGSAAYISPQHLQAMGAARFASPSTQVGLAYPSPNMAVTPPNQYLYPHIHTSPKLTSSSLFAMGPSGPLMMSALSCNTTLSSSTPINILNSTHNNITGGGKHSSKSPRSGMSGKKKKRPTASVMPAASPAVPQNTAVIPTKVNTDVKVSTTKCTGSAESLSSLSQTLIPVANLSFLTSSQSVYTVLSSMTTSPISTPVLSGHLSGDASVQARVTPLTVHIPLVPPTSLVTSSSTTSVYHGNFSPLTPSETESTGSPSFPGKVVMPPNSIPEIKEGKRPGIEKNKPVVSRDSKSSTVCSAPEVDRVHRWSRDSGGSSGSFANNNQSIKSSCSLDSATDSAPESELYQSPPKRTAACTPAAIRMDIPASIMSNYEVKLLTTESGGMPSEKEQYHPEHSIPPVAVSNVDMHKIASRSSADTDSLSSASRHTSEEGESSLVIDEDLKLGMKNKTLVNPSRAYEIHIYTYIFGSYFLVHGFG